MAWPPSPSGLRKLSVGWCAFCAMGLDAILRGCSQLEELSIKSPRGLPHAFSPPFITESIAGSASLRSIRMKSIYNWQFLASLIAGSPNLKTLTLICCFGDWDFVLMDLAEKVPGITGVHLVNVNVSDLGVAALAACLNLEVLELAKTPDCTDAGLSAAVEGCRLLRRIHISDIWKVDGIGDEGLIAIAMQCPDLQELVLVNVDPTARSLGLIASNCRSLERLAVRCSDTFGDTEIACIAAKCMALKELCIEMCPISDQGMGALAQGCPNLIKVKVNRCRGVTRRSADWLMARRDGALAVSLDTAVPSKQEVGVAEKQILMDPPSSSAATRPSRTRRVGSLAVRSFVASALKRWLN